MTAGANLPPSSASPSSPFDAAINAIAILATKYGPIDQTVNDKYPPCKQS